MNSYYRSPLFVADCLAIYDDLTALTCFESVWRMVSGIPENNGVGFCWKGQRFRIHWQQGFWYLLGQQFSFCAAARREVVDFCICLVSVSFN